MISPFFFKEKGFEITSDSKVIFASYGNKKVCLSHSDPDTVFMGCYFTFELDLKSLGGIKYSIILKNGKPKIRFKAFPSTGSKDDELRNKIKSVHYDIDKAQKRINSFSREEWEFFYRDCDSSQNNSFSDSFKSMYEILTSLIE